ncbi:DUF5804 family protein [Methanofollis fontis]|uniref:Uncharacterized protein n=1 Tax=Methanofollis fontis TaxID=2052832 RepID=A0A483CLD2_9EURY|nr:DUF5804 family protein [Methanofollis fontis]TAJ43819.1 hypothetical protein CUJ86_07055 [Methanofollis fontis]
MELLLIGKDGTDLYHTLFSSETSREILRFYRPKRRGFGISVTVISLGAALSLASELRWYIRRYVRLALIEAEPGTYWTLGYARAIDGREGDRESLEGRTTLFSLDESPETGGTEKIRVRTLPDEEIG